MFEKKKVIALDDVRLARKAQKDRPTAEKVLRRLQPKIFQVIWATVRSSQQAEEIGQIVALEILRSLHNFRGEAPLEAWAGGIAYRVTMRTLDKERTWDRFHTTIDEAANVQSGAYLNTSGNPPGTGQGSTPEKVVLKQQLLDSLLIEMNHIPAKRRTPLVLHFVQGYTVHEISSMLQVSPNTIKDRLKTALREMRHIFDQNPSLGQSMLEEIR